MHLFKWVCWWVAFIVNTYWQWWHQTVVKALSNMIICWKISAIIWFQDLSSCCWDMTDDRKIDWMKIKLQLIEELKKLSWDWKKFLMSS